MSHSPCATSASACPATRTSGCSRTQGGTGLGLPISREDAVLHGGSLQAWGRPGEGSEFVLTLPKTVPPADAQKDGGGGPAPLVQSVFA